MSLLESMSAALPAIDLRSIGDIEREIDDELTFHLEMRTRENLRAGHDPQAAREAAIARFGNLDRIRRQCRQALLGERLMLQKLQAVLMVVLLAAVAWLAYRVQAGQRATETALSDFAAAVQQLANKPQQLSSPPAGHAPAPDWRPDRPVVVGTVPETNSTDVDPTTSEIRITFSKEMADESWSWVRASEHEFPESTGEVHYLDDRKTCVMPVKLDPGTKYVLWLNTARYQNFKDVDGRPAEPYLLTFTTGNKSDVTTDATDTPDQ